jgi:hypothetical protein
MQKIKYWKYVQILAASKNQADCKILAGREKQAEGKILAGAENQADSKILAAAESQADGKILAGVEISASSEILWSWKSWRPTYCLGSAESPTADFSLVLLMSTFCSSLM